MGCINVGGCDRGLQECWLLVVFTPVVGTGGYGYGNWLILETVYYLFMWFLDAREA